MSKTHEQALSNLIASDVLDDFWTFHEIDGNQVLVLIGSNDPTRFQAIIAHAKTVQHVTGTKTADTPAPTEFVFGAHYTDLLDAVRGGLYGIQGVPTVRPAAPKKKATKATPEPTADELTATLAASLALVTKKPAAPAPAETKPRKKPVRKTTVIEHESTEAAETAARNELTALGVITKVA
jgi:hypothetical protein